MYDLGVPLFQETSIHFHFHGILNSCQALANLRYPSKSLISSWWVCILAKDDSHILTWEEWCKIGHQKMQELNATTNKPNTSKIKFYGPLGLQFQDISWHFHWYPKKEVRIFGGSWQKPAWCGFICIFVCQNAWRCRDFHTEAIRMSDQEHNETNLRFYG